MLAGAIKIWKVNIAKFREIKYIQYNGYKKDFLGVEELSEYDVILSTYTYVSRQYNTYASRTYDIKAAVSGSADELKIASEARREGKSVKSSTDLLRRTPSGCRIIVSKVPIIWVPRRTDVNLMWNLVIEKEIDESTQ